MTRRANIMIMFDHATRYTGIIPALLVNINGQGTCQRLANGEHFFSLGDPDQNIRHLSGSSYSGAEKRIANCQYILVIHRTRAILLYYCKGEYVCIYKCISISASISTKMPLLSAYRVTMAQSTYLLQRIPKRTSSPGLC